MAKVLSQIDKEILESFRGVWKTMPTVISAVTAMGYVRKEVDVRAVSLQRSDLLNRKNNTGGTLYRLNEKLYQHQYTTPPIVNAMQEAFKQSVSGEELSENPVAVTSKTMEPLSNKDSIAHAIWKVMSDHVPYTVGELSILLDVVGFKRKSVTNAVAELHTKKNWFTRTGKGGVNDPYKYTLNPDIKIPTTTGVEMGTQSNMSPLDTLIKGIETRHDDLSEIEHTLTSEAKVVMQETTNVGEDGVVKQKETASTLSLSPITTAANTHVPLSEVLNNIFPQHTIASVLGRDEVLKPFVGGAVDFKERLVEMDAGIFNANGDKMFISFTFKEMLEIHKSLHMMAIVTPVVPENGLVKTNYTITVGEITLTPPQAQQLYKEISYYLYQIIGDVYDMIVTK